jgi:hypothetical protein
MSSASEGRREDTRFHDVEGNIKKLTTFAVVAALAIAFVRAIGSHASAGGG